MKQNSLQVMKIITGVSFVIVLIMQAVSADSRAAFLKNAGIAQEGS